MRTVKHKQGFTLVTLAVALSLAVYLNWEYAKTTDSPLATETSAEAEAGTLTDPLATETDAGESPQNGDKNYGEAQLVSLIDKGGTEFFEQARMDRTKSRDTALDSLKKSLKGTGLSSEEKNALTQQLTEKIDNITAESEIETLIKAKGFADCVTFIDDGQVNVTVMSANDTLQADEVAQIRDIVLSKCSVKAQDIHVVEIK